MTAPIPNGPATTLTVMHGKPVDLVLQAFLLAAESKLGYELTILQGYNPDNEETSAGTHGFGVADLAPYDWEHKLRVIKDLGAFAWHREEIDGLWPEHLHFGIRNHPGLSPSAKRQQIDYDKRPIPIDGLAGHTTPDRSYHPDPPVQFRFPVKTKPTPPPVTHVTKARDALVEAIAAVSTSIVELRDADESRVIARGLRPDLRHAREDLRGILDEMPKR